MALMASIADVRADELVRRYSRVCRAGSKSEIIGSRLSKNSRRSSSASAKLRRSLRTGPSVRSRLMRVIGTHWGRRVVRVPCCHHHHELVISVISPIHPQRARDRGTYPADFLVHLDKLTSRYLARPWTHSGAAQLHGPG